MISTATPPAPTASTATTGDWLLQTWRLTRWDLFAAWRRVMSKVLLGILLGFFAVIVGFIVLAFVITANSPVQGQTCSPVPVATDQSGSGSSSGGQQVQCQSLPAQQQQQIRDQETSAVRSPVTFPGSVQLAGGYTTFIGVILLSILAGAVVGGEFGFGTMRLALSRGMGRAQVLTAQVAALAILSLAIGLVMVLLGILIGVTIGPLLGATLPALASGGALALVGYWLAVSLHLFAFAAIAFFVATAARSTAAGIAVPLGYYIFEVIAVGILSALAFAIRGNLGDFLGHVPDWLLSQNLGVIATNAFAPLQSASSTVQSSGGGINQPTFGLGHALLVSAAYCVLLVGFAYVIMRRRDITD
jgi:ABC-2 type transport system permease protein